MREIEKDAREEAEKFVQDLKHLRTEKGKVTVVASMLQAFYYSQTLKNWKHEEK